MPFTQVSGDEVGQRIDRDGPAPLPDPFQFAQSGPEILIHIG
ncbi:hypothetical protein ACIHDR_35255 [Nocardia sp. NPDC052278]